MTELYARRPVKLDKPAMEVLEEPLIKTPYELMRKNHRSAQRQVEKEFGQMQNTLKGLLSDIQGGTTTAEQVLAKLKESGERPAALKRKIEAIQPSPRLDEPMRSRLGLVRSLEDFPDTIDASEQEWQRWSQNRLNRFMVEHLLRQGRFETARVFAESRGLADHVDFALFSERSRIGAALQTAHSCTEALAWCGENRGTLKKTKNDLEFTLRMQEYIELCRKRDAPAALAYLHKHISPWRDTHFRDITQAIALLAYDGSTLLPPYQALYDDGRWLALRKTFTETFNALYGLPSQSLLDLTVQAGLCTLKLSACNANEAASSSAPATSLDDDVPALPAAPPIHIMPAGASDPSLSASMDTTPLHADPSHRHTNLDCPTCQPSMHALVKEAAYSHHVNSTIVCRISGKVMDDENYPMAMPNGHVYSSQALQSMAADSYGGVVTCPRTGEQTTLTRLRKVFVS